MAEKAQLKRLSFVERAAKTSADAAKDAYKSLKGGVLPRFVKVRLEEAESVAGEYTAPAYNRLLSTSHALLTFADDKLDYALVHGSQFVRNTAQEVRNVAEPEALRKNLHSAKDAVSANTTKAIDFFKSHGVVGATQYFFSESLQTTKKAVASGRSLATSALDRSQKSANNVLASAHGLVDVATKKSRAAHDAVVKQPLYKDAYERTNHIVTGVQDTKVYKVTINRLYPIVAPVYNPAFEKIEPYYTSTVNYWKPVSAAA